jgi:hypothetical protein
MLRFQQLNVFCIMLACSVVLPIYLNKRSDPIQGGNFHFETILDKDPFPNFLYPKKSGK